MIKRNITLLLDILWNVLNFIKLVEMMLALAVIEIEWLGLKLKNSKKYSNNQPAVHRGEETIEDVREIKNKNGDDAEPLQVDLEPPVEAEEPEVDDHVRERHYAIVWKRDIVSFFCNEWQNV